MNIPPVFFHCSMHLVSCCTDACDRALTCGQNQCGCVESQLCVRESQKNLSTQTETASTPARLMWNKRRMSSTCWSILCPKPSLCPTEQPDTILRWLQLTSGLHPRDTVHASSHRIYLSTTGSEVFGNFILWPVCFVGIEFHFNNYNLDKTN
jgi:hypothetical protein